METYEEKYKDLVKRLNKAREEKGVYTFNSVLDAVAPEIKIEESEDERIINRIKKAVEKYWSDEPLDEILAWLEKQAEQNLAFIEKGKWYVCIRTSYKPNGKDFIEGKTYYAKEDYKIIGECGEVDIATDNPEEFFRSATEEETNDIMKNFVNEQKPAWSEEDEKILSDIIKDLVHPWNEYIPDRIEDEIKWLKNKLKSLRLQTTWKPSDEQMGVLNEVIRNPYLSTAEYNGLVALREQLKAL